MSPGLVRQVEWSPNETPPVTYTARATRTLPAVRVRARTEPHNRRQCGLLSLRELIYPARFIC
jgi:hypothetical protein